MDPNDQCDRLSRRLTALKGQRQPHESEWRQCFDYTYPERANGLEGAVVTSTDSKSRQAEIYDDTAKDGTRIMASSCSSGMTPANSQWLGLDVGTENDAEARWLSDAAQFLFDNIHAANFDAAGFECLIDMVSGPGMFVLYTEEAKEGGYQFEHWPFGQCFVSASKSGGRVDTIYREFTLTVEQLVAEYGEAKVSERTREKFANHQVDEPVRVLWAIEPRAAVKGAEGARMARNKPFASFHVELDTKHVLRESGYDEFPCCVPRWMLIPGSHYAKGPMSACLATVKTLNEIKKLDLINFEMSAYGMFKATDDGVLNPHTTKIGPRRIVVVADMENFQAVERGGDPQLSALTTEQMQAQIRKLLMADQLQPQDGPAMTATEVHARVMLVRQQLGPVFGRLQSEYLTPLVERCFGIAFRSGALVRAIGPMPETLGQKNVNITFSSPLARAQKLEEVTATDQWVGGLVGYAAQTGDTSVLDEINTTEIARFRRDALGVPSIAQRSPEEVARLRQRREEAAKAQQQQQIAAQGQLAMQDAAAKQAAAA